MLRERIDAAMIVQQEEHEGVLTVRLEGALSIYEVAHCKEELLGSLHHEGPLELDLQGVTECDLAGLQLLLGYRRSRRQQKLPLCFTNIPQVVKDLAKSGGVQEKDLL